MCGIFGIASFAKSSTSSLATKAISKLHHRGPDGSNIWTSQQLGVSLAHSRLSILDLTPAGNQPMQSLSGRYIMVFNGEIYNHQELRSHLNKKSVDLLWTGHSDSETLLTCFDILGIQETLKLIVGMFAIVLWDIKERKFILMRDRFGEKPLYYGYTDNFFVFSSELSAIKTVPDFKAEIDRNALSLYLSHLYVPTPHCIFHGIRKLNQGSWLEISLDEISKKNFPEPTTYWSATKEAYKGVSEQIKYSSDIEAVDQLELLLKQSISRQILADVPVGAFLSGGVDSSTIVSIMQSISSVPVETFSIGFSNNYYDEAKYAKSIAHHLRTAHTELYVKPSDALDIIPSLPEIYDEPFADSSQIPTYLVSKLAKAKVTVSLSGDGGDELFGGYNRYLISNNAWKKTLFIPSKIRKKCSHLINMVDQDRWNDIYGAIENFIPKTYRVANPGDKIHKFSSILSCNDPDELYKKLTHTWNHPDIIINSEKANKSMYTWPKLENTALEMMLLDTNGYLMDDILVKVDRASMHCSLETRVPFLDHNIYDFASKLPYKYKIRSGVGKWILREVLNRHVPKELIDRPKMGFSIPLDDWLRGPLKDWASNLLDPNRIQEEGYFSHKIISKKWKQHLSGEKNLGASLWAILMFESWLENNK